MIRQRPAVKLQGGKSVIRLKGVKQRVVLKGQRPRVRLKGDWKNYYPIRPKGSV
jgi:hypothetical protein